MADLFDPLTSLTNDGAGQLLVGHHEENKDEKKTNQHTDGDRETFQMTEKNMGMGNKCMQLYINSKFLICHLH